MFSGDTTPANSKALPSGQQSLMDVLRALAHLFPEVGYCQGTMTSLTTPTFSHYSPTLLPGMSFIAAVLLMRMPAEEAFKIFAAILERGINNLMNGPHPIRLVQVTK